MNYKRHIAILIFVWSIATCCQSQSNDYKIIIPAKVEIKFDTIYPHASNIAWNKRLPTDNIQVVEFDCNCQEGLGQLTITYDTTGNVLNKSILIAKQDLPAAIIDYITNNYPNEFEYRNITKFIDHSSEITYSVAMKQAVPDGNATTGWTYVLKFNGAGQFISQEKR